MLDAIPPEALTDDVAILGKKGAGKSYTARGEVEALLDLGRRACIVDPTGVWFGLRLLPDGKTASPYQVVIFGGDHGDIDLAGVSGGALAELVAGAGFSCIIDTKRLTVAERTRIWTEFAERLGAVNKTPLHLVVDEAHLFAPQGRVNDPQSGRMLHATNNLFAGGRALGIRGMLITQRPAKLHKDTLSGVETMVAMRMVAPQDRAAVEDWVKEQADLAKGREIVASLPSLPTGEGWVWSPQLDVLERARFRAIRTFDSSRTPQDGAAAPEPARLAELDLALLQAALAPARTAPAKAMKATPAAPPAEPDPARIEAAYRQGFEVGYRTAYGSGWNAAIGAAQDAFGKLLNAAPREPSPKSIGTNFSLLHDIPAPEDARTPDAPPEPPRGRNDGLVARMLAALTRSPFRALTPDEVAILAIASPISGPARLAKRELAALEAVELDATGRLTARGWRQDAPGKLTGDEVVDGWRRKQGGMQAEILGRLFAKGELTRDEVAADLGRSPISGPWRGAWKVLRNNLLVEEIDGKRWRLAWILRELPRAKAPAP